MKYSNGYDMDRVLPALLGRVGWKQPTVTGSPTIDTANATSKSGRHFQVGFHALVTVDNVKRTMPEANANDANLNEHLADLQKAAILRCLNSVFRDTGEDKYSQQVLLFDRLGQNDMPEDNSGKFVGYEFNLAPKVDLAHAIDRVELYFDQDITFKLYLFKDGKKSPIADKEVTTEAFESTVVELSEFVLKYFNADVMGGRYYFGYFQDDLGSARAIRAQVVCQNQATCFSAQPVYMQRKPGEYDFNRDQRSYLAMPYGLNLSVNSFRDYTDMIIRKASLFDEAIGLCVAYSVVENIIYTVRSNATERILKDELDRAGINLDLNGVAPISDSPRAKGLSQRIDAELTRIRKVFYPNARPIGVNLASCSC